MTSGDDPQDPSQPYLFGAALDDAEREDEAKRKAEERRCLWCDNDGAECLCDDVVPLCGACNGSGEGMHDGTKCRKCGGSGTLEKWPKRKQEAEE